MKKELKFTPQYSRKSVKIPQKPRRKKYTMKQFKEDLMLCFILFLFMMIFIVAGIIYLY